MAKDLEMGYLLDFYGEVLTEKQREMLRQYYNDDLSLSEIGENFGITRQGARDAIKHGENALKELEEKVGFAARYRRVQQKLEELEQMVIDARFECTGPNGLTTTEYEHQLTGMLKLIRSIATDQFCCLIQVRFQHLGSIRSNRCRLLISIFCNSCCHIFCHIHKYRTRSSALCNGKCTADRRCKVMDIFYDHTVFGDVLFCLFSRHGKFQISCFRRTAKTGNQQFFISLVWIRDIVQSFLVCYFNGEDLNICHSSFTIAFNSFISSGYRSPVVFTFFAIWLIFMPILCISLPSSLRRGRAGQNARVH